MLKKDDQTYIVSTRTKQLVSLRLLELSSGKSHRQVSRTRRNLNALFCFDSKTDVHEQIVLFFFFLPLFFCLQDNELTHMQTKTHPPHPATASYATWLLSSTSAILLISPTKATHHWASAVQGTRATLVGRSGGWKSGGGGRAAAVDTMGMTNSA